jgi:PHD - plant homeodomain finger protein
MKRPWSYDDDLDRDGGADRSRRRFYLKLDERRRRVEHEGDGSGSGTGSGSGSSSVLGLAYDRRRSGGLDKHRSSSLTSGLKRNFFPKGFRSERGDRHRRDGSSGGGSSSSWRRFGGGGDEELESLSRASKTRSKELRENVRSREICSSGERSSKLEEMKEEARKESSSGSEMEEGELEPEPMQESVAEAKKSATEEDEKKDWELGLRDGQSEAVSDKKGHFSGDNLESFGKDTCQVEPVKIFGDKTELERVSSEETEPERVYSEETEPDKLSTEETERDKVSSDELTREGEGENKLEIELLQKEDTLHISDKECLCERAREGKNAAVLAANERPKDDQMPTQTEQAGANLPEQGVVKSLELCGTDLPEKYAANLLCQTEEVVGENNCEDNTLNLLANRPSYHEKGKGLAVDLDTEVEGSTCKGFDLMFRPEPRQNGRADTKDDNEKMKMDKLDLSLGLPGISVDCQNSKIKPGSPPPSHMKSVQSLPSASFTASVSLSGSQFVHNPSCSLNQNSLENLEQSVKSRPLFQPVEQIINGVPTTIWQPKITDDVKHETGTVARAPLLQRNNSSLNKAATLARNSSFSSRLSSDEHSRERRQLLKSESQSFNNRAGVIEKVISKIVYEPLHLTGRMLQEMKDNSVSYLKHAICEIVASAEKKSHVTALQEALDRRSDLTTDTLSKCPRVLLEMLLVLKTGLPDYIKRSSAVSTSDLVDIFLKNKCRNLDCRSMVPVDDCECKVCKSRHGFCSSCMCMMCANFDLASNTCSWVGCDVCLHWCHTECGLRNLLIRPGGSESQMQFYCLACGHPSEMFGFVKEVFKTCAKEWKVEVLARELRFVRKIFGSSEDLRGRRLRDLVGQMLSRLEDGADRAEVVRFILGFFAGKLKTFIVF